MLCLESTRKTATVAEFRIMSFVSLGLIDVDTIHSKVASCQLDHLQHDTLFIPFVPGPYPSKLFYGKCSRHILTLLRTYN